VPDLRDLHDTFFPAGDGLQKTASPTPEKPASAQDELARALGINKASSATPSTENEMKSLSDIYTGLVNLEKQAAATTTHRTAALEKKAEAMARSDMRKEAAMMKTAAEYDAAGRIMARGFVDEFQSCIAHLEKVGMEGYVAGQIENDIETDRGGIDTGKHTQLENADLASGAESSTVEGVKTQLGVTASGLGGGEVGKIMTIKDQLTLPAAATATNLGG
jgi:hypothetical protein